ESVTTPSAVEAVPAEGAQSQPNQSAPATQPVVAPHIQAPTVPATPGAVPLDSAAPAYPAQQPELSQALMQLRSRGEGVHQLTIQLHPAELGVVNVTAVLS